VANLAIRRFCTHGAYIELVKQLLDPRFSIGEPKDRRVDRWLWDLGVDGWRCDDSPDKR